MKLKMKLMAAAVALAASAGANAAMDNFASGNGSLAFVALDFTGAPISVMMDLDFNVDSFLPAAMSASGTTIQWNFNTNSLTVNGIASGSTQTNWSNALGSFSAVAQSAETKWGVIGGDSISLSGSTTQIRYLSTAAPGTTLATMQGQTKSNLSGFAGVDALYNANNLLQTAENGSTASSGQAWVGDGGSFGNAGKWQNKSSWVTWANVGETADFYMADGNNGISSTRALITPYAGEFTYAAGVLTYAVAAVPEPSEYALMLAGLGMIGFMARRRLNHRA
ncbi:MAG: PEP-CTERM sorting domain-containing protein [Rugosibacter sp.]|nr:PEP-CTERM sorting domain-containing protein [Rugosibacter sp.]